MDQAIFLSLNGMVGEYPLFDQILRHLGSSYFKVLPLVLIIWGLWFAGGDRIERRVSLLAVMLLAMPAVAVARVLSKILPFHYRPLHDPDVEARVASGLVPGNLDGWSSMPSDHAALFFGVSAGIFLVSRLWGSIALLHSLIVVAFARVYFGWHWPSDILVGAVLGIVTVVALKPVFEIILRRLGVVPFFEAREWLGYPLLFLFSYEFAQMFNFTRYVVEGLIG